MAEKIEDMEQRTFDEDDAVEVPPGDIVAYNELRSCADLHRMYVRGILEIQPEFQRDIVWKNPGRTRFIDSLMKQLPIPSMCFSLDYKSQKWQVIDGLQRISTIIAFLGDENWTLSKLEDVDQSISGKPVREFRDVNNPLHALYTRVENLTLPITVLRCDTSKKSHNNYLFMIFHRLNTGGMKLNNQEIRNCIYSGSFNDLLKKLARDKNWIAVQRKRGARNMRMQYEEMALRFFAFSDSFENYNGRLARYLNDYMADHRNPTADWVEHQDSTFHRTVRAARRVLEALPAQRFTISVLEALLVGLGSVEGVENKETEQLSVAFEEMRANPEFSEESLREGLAHTPRLLGRLRAAVFAFSRV